MSGEPRLRILFLANARSVHTKRWVGWFAKRHDVLLASLPPLPAADFGEPGITLAPEGPETTLPVLAGLRYVKYLRDLIRSFRPDVVHGHSLNPASWIVAATGFEPTVATAWGSDLLLATGLTRALQRWALRRTTLCTADSRAAVERLAELVSDPSRVHLVQFGVDTDAFRPGAPTGELRRLWNIPAHARVIVSPRLLRPLYNQRTVARAFARIAPRYPDTYLVFLDYLADRGYRDQVEADLAATAFADRVRIAAPLTHALMPQLYQEASVLVSVPSSDTTPVTVLEGMASGTPIIASDLASLREWLTHDDNGFLVPSEQAEPLAHALEHALALSPERRAGMAERNRRAVIERASQDLEMGRMEAILRRALQRPRHRRLPFP